MPFNRYQHPWAGRQRAETQAVARRRAQLRRLIEKDEQREEAQRERDEARREVGHGGPAQDDDG
jgi:hypothetical protein